MATHSCILAWRAPWTEEPGEPQSMGLQSETWLIDYFVAAAAAKPRWSCPTVQPHRRPPTRLCRPWDSPGKNTGVSCHCLLQCMKVKTWTAAHQALPSMGFSRQEYWSGVPLPSTHPILVFFYLWFTLHQECPFLKNFSWLCFFILLMQWLLIWRSIQYIWYLKKNVALTLSEETMVWKIDNIDSNFFSFSTEGTSNDV